MFRYGTSTTISIDTSYVGGLQGRKMTEYNGRVRIGVLIALSRSLIRETWRERRAGLYP